MPFLSKARTRSDAAIALTGSNRLQAPRLHWLRSCVAQLTKFVVAPSYNGPGFQQRRVVTIAGGEGNDFAWPTYRLGVLAHGSTKLQNSGSALVRSWRNSPPQASVLAEARTAVKNRAEMLASTIATTICRPLTGLRHLIRSQWSRGGVAVSMEPSYSRAP